MLSKMQNENKKSRQKRVQTNSRSILQRKLHPEGLRQRRSSPVLALVSRSNSQTAHEIRNGKHTQEFYLRHGLLPVTSES